LRHFDKIRPGNPTGFFDLVALINDLKQENNPQDSSTSKLKMEGWGMHQRILRPDMSSGIKREKRSKKSDDFFSSSRF
jgi:hypothetical protein